MKNDVRFYNVFLPSQDQQIACGVTSLSVDIHYLCLSTLPSSCLYKCFLFITSFHRLRAQPIKQHQFQPLFSRYSILFLIIFRHYSSSYTWSFQLFLLQASLSTILSQRSLISSQAYATQSIATQYNRKVYLLSIYRRPALLRKPSATTA